MKSSLVTQTFCRVSMALLVGLLVEWSPAHAARGVLSTQIQVLTINPVLQRSMLGRRLTMEMNSLGPSTLGPLVVQVGERQFFAAQPSDLNASSKQPGQLEANARPGVSRRYFITDLGTLGGTQSFALGINALGQVFGTSRITGDEESHAFLYSAGSMSDLGPLGETMAGGALNNSGQIATIVVAGGVVAPAIYDSQTAAVTVLPSLGGVSSFGWSGVATSINNLGEAVGYSYIDPLTPHAFLYYNGATTDIGSFGGYSYASAINDAGVIVGHASNTFNGSAHAFVYSNGVMVDIDPFGDSGFSTSLSVATDINTLGQVVGYFLKQDESTTHAFYYEGGSFTDLGLTGSPETNASAINDQGQIVGVHLVRDRRVCADVGNGEFCFDTYKMHAFLYDAERINDLNSLIPSDLGWELSWAFDINNYGQIVGYGVLNDKFRAFLLTPALSKEQCKKGGWKKFGFKNQGQCIQFLNTGK